MSVLWVLLPIGLMVVITLVAGYFTFFHHRRDSKDGFGDPDESQDSREG